MKAATTLQMSRGRKVSTISSIEVFRASIGTTEAVPSRKSNSRKQFELLESYNQHGRDTILCLGTWDKTVAPGFAMFAI
jgi:hypothetical protein